MAVSPSFMWRIGGCVIPDARKRGLGLKEGSLHGGFGGFDGVGSSGKHLALPWLVPQNTGQRGNSDGFGGYGTVMAAWVMTVTPLNVYLPFSDNWNFSYSVRISRMYFHCSYTLLVVFTIKQ